MTKTSKIIATIVVVAVILSSGFLYIGSKSNPSTLQGRIARKVASIVVKKTVKDLRGYEGNMTGHYTGNLRINKVLFSKGGVPIENCEQVVNEVKKITFQISDGYGTPTIGTSSLLVSKNSEEKIKISGNLNFSSNRSQAYVDYFQKTISPETTINGKYIIENKSTGLENTYILDMSGTATLKGKKFYTYDLVENYDHDCSLHADTYIYEGTFDVTNITTALSDISSVIKNLIKESKGIPTTATEWETLLIKTFPITPYPNKITQMAIALSEELEGKNSQEILSILNSYTQDDGLLSKFISRLDEQSSEPSFATLTINGKVIDSATDKNVETPGQETIICIAYDQANNKIADAEGSGQLGADGPFHGTIDVKNIPTNTYFSVECKVTPYGYSEGSGTLTYPDGISADKPDPNMVITATLLPVTLTLNGKIIDSATGNNIETQGQDTIICIAYDQGNNKIANADGSGKSGEDGSFHGTIDVKNIPTNTYFSVECKVTPYGYSEGSGTLTYPDGISADKTDSNMIITAAPLLIKMGLQGTVYNSSGGKMGNVKVACNGKEYTTHGSESSVPGNYYLTFDNVPNENNPAYPVNCNLTNQNDNAKMSENFTIEIKKNINHDAVTHDFTFKKQGGKP